MTDLITKWKQAVGSDQVRAGNRVTPLINGQATYKAMYDAIQTTRRLGHYVYLLGWSLDLDLSLTGEKDVQKPTASMRSLLTAAADRNVQVRVMLWSYPFEKNNRRSIAWINRLGRTDKAEATVDRLSGRDAAGIRDTRTLPLSRDARTIELLLAEFAELAREHAASMPDFEVRNFVPTGSHHQKVLLVRGEKGLIAFCGGLDIFRDRVEAVSLGAPQHDVHCSIEGPAAHDLVDVFVSRWQAHPAHKEIDQTRHMMALSDRSSRGRPSKGDQQVRIARNFNFVGASFNPICAAERSVEPVLLGAIRASTKFIYIEDQYLGSLKAAFALQRQLPKLQHITIIVPHQSVERVFPWRRRDFLRILCANDRTGKVRVFYRYTKDQNFGPYSYIHSKTWVFDDELAVIGSANCNNRGWGFDSEVIAAIFDVAPGATPTSFAQRLRARLWAWHLGVDEQKVAHGFAPEVMQLWDDLPETASVCPYDREDPGVRTGFWKALDPSQDRPWDLYVDPRGDNIPKCSTSRPTLP